MLHSGKDFVEFIKIKQTCPYRKLHYINQWIFFFIKQQHIFHSFNNRFILCGGFTIQVPVKDLLVEIIMY